VLTLVAGVVLAWLLRMGVAVVAGWINRFTARRGAGEGTHLSPGFTQALQLFAFWGVLVIAMIRSVTLLGGAQFDLLDGVLVLATRLLLALTIVAVGHVLGVLARNLLSGLARGTDLAALPRLVYALIVGISLVMALAHLGLDVSLITYVTLVVFAVFFAALGLAFALGARTLVANLAAQGELARYRPGDHLRVDGAEGTVLEIDRTGVVLSTSEGLARIPAAKFAECTVVVLIRESEDDG
jgi:hypothetical protein